MTKWVIAIAFAFSENTLSHQRMTVSDHSISVWQYVCLAFYFAYWWKKTMLGCKYQWKFKYLQMKISSKLRFPRECFLFWVDSSLVQFCACFCIIHSLFDKAPSPAFLFFLFFFFGIGHPPLFIAKVGGKEPSEVYNTRSFLFPYHST